jgi:hypothetical protein
MAKKRTEKKDVGATAEMETRVPPKRRLANPVRLDLSDRDYARLEQLAERRGLNKASYARQAVMFYMKRDEEEEKL